MTPSPDLISSAWVINAWLIDASTLVLSPRYVGALKHDIFTTKLEASEAIEESNKEFIVTTSMVDSYPY